MAGMAREFVVPRLSHHCARRETRPGVRGIVYGVTGFQISHHGHPKCRVPVTSQGDRQAETRGAYPGMECALRLGRSRIRMRR